MAVITSAGTYGPSAVAVRSGSVSASRLSSRQAELAEASGAQDRAEISREAAKLVADKRPMQIVQVLASSTGRTQARISNMRDLAPPSDGNVGFSEFKGTKALVDARAAAAVRVRSIDLTVGGPNSAGALKGAQIFKAPEPKAEDTQLGSVKIQAAQAEERAKAIAEARAAAQRAAQRLQPLGGLNGGETAPSVREAKPTFQIGRAETEQAPVVRKSAFEDDRGRETRSVEEERRDERAERKDEPATRQSAARAPAYGTPPGKTLNFLA